MANLVIFTIFKAKDKLSSPTKGIDKRIKSLGKSAKKSSVSVGGMFKAFLGSQIAFAALGKIGQGLSVVTEEFISFDSAVTAAGAKFGNAFKKGTEGAKELRKTARGIGAVTEFSATQAAEGLDFLAMAGFNASQSMALLPGVVDLATATGQDLARSTDIASDALGAFGLMSKDTGELTENFSRILDVMAKTTVTANTDMETLFEAVKKGAPTFTNAGQSVETFNDLIGVMANSGVKGSEAGTQLRNMMLRLAAPTKQAQGVLNQLGVSTKTADGNFRDAIDILADFESSTKNMGTAQKTAALATVFGARTVNGINILLQEGTDSLKEYRKQLEGAGGSSKELAEEMRKSLRNSLEKIKSSLIELGFKFFDLFGDKIQMALNSISGFINKLNELFGANQKIIDQGFGEIFGFIAEKAKFLFNIVSDIVKTFVEVGEKQGVFTELESTMTSLKKTVNSVFEALGQVWEALKDAGAVDAIVLAFKRFLQVLRLIFAILRPILKLLVLLFKGIMKILKPFIKLGNALQKLQSGVLGKILGKEKEEENQEEEDPGEIIEDEGPGGEIRPRSTNARLRRLESTRRSESREVSESRVSLDFNNVPKGTTVKQSGRMRGVKLDVGDNR